MKERVRKARLEKIKAARDWTLKTIGKTLSDLLVVLTVVTVGVLFTMIWGLDAISKALSEYKYWLEQK